MTPEQRVKHAARVLKYKNKNRAKIQAHERVAAAKRRAANPEKYRSDSRRQRGVPEPTRPEPKYCECCGGCPRGKHKRFVVDHEHLTGEFRGWLCDICNRAIGMLGDNHGGVFRALKYLERT
jgi:hypothetical protein